jgi:DNA replication protein DnaD
MHYISHAPGLQAGFRDGMTEEGRIRRNLLAPARLTCYNANMEHITMTIEEMDRLLAIEDGDAALVFLSAKRGREPNIGDTRLLQARKKLSGAGMLPSLYADRPSYSQSEIARSKLTDPGFSTVVDAAECLLGKALSPSDLQTLMGIRKWHGLPGNVVLLLLHYCHAEQQKRGRVFTLRQMDKEAQVWEREGILDEESAELYIERKERARDNASRVLRALGIFDRMPSATEKAYVASWLDMGFTVEAVALAYDKTVVNTGRLSWKYCDTILRRWHDKGWHTPGEIETFDIKTPSASKNDVTGSYDRNRKTIEKAKAEEDMENDS